MKILKKINVLLDKKQKWNMAGLLVMMLIGAILEACIITLVIPVISLVISPDKFQQNEIVQKIFHLLKMESVTQFTVFVMLALVMAFALKNVFLFFQQKLMYRFVYTNQFNTS